MRYNSEIGSFEKKVLGKYNGLKKAFSLAESLITLVLICILAAVLIPALKGTNPESSEMLHKKSTYIVERVVNELVTDEFLYPNNSINAGLSNLAPVKVNGNNHGGASKFCTLFASRVNLAAGTSVNCLSEQKSFTSVEGIDWYMPISDFQTAQIIRIDVNGEKDPNCKFNDECRHPDQFEYQIKSGTRVNAVEVVNLAPTAPPGARPGMGIAPDTTPNDPRTAQKWWSISCAKSGPGLVFGEGGNKPNGQYKLVAIPALGHKGSWFIKNVTVENSNVTDCAVSFTPDTLRPNPDGGIVNPPVTPPVEPETPKTYCINVTMTGDKTQCAFAGDGCDKVPGKYVVTASSVTGSEYTPSWTIQEPTIVDKNINLALECNKGSGDKCYSITTTGDTVNCPVTMPTPNCKTDKTKYLNGTHKVTVTPKAGYTHNNLTTASNRDVLIAGKDEVVNIVCDSVAATPPVVNIYVEDSFTGARKGAPAYHHTYKYYYGYKRSLRIAEAAAKDLDVKMTISGKYTGKEELCVPYNFAGSCRTETLTLTENDIDDVFSKPINQVLTKTSSATWDAFTELGTGKGGYADEFIKSGFSQYSLSVKGKDLLTNQSYPSGAFTTEVKDGTTTYKIHFVPANAYLIRIYDQDSASGKYLKGVYSDAWANGMTHMSLNQHVVHKGENMRIQPQATVMLDSDPEPYYYSGVYYNNTMVCSAPSDGSAPECSFAINSGNAHPSENAIVTMYRQHRPGGGGGGGGDGTPTSATLTLTKKYSANNLGANCTEGWQTYSVKSSNVVTPTVTAVGSGSVCTYNASSGQVIGCYGDASVNETGSSIKFRYAYNCFPRGDSEYENLDWNAAPSCTINIGGKQVSCEAGSRITVNKVNYLVSVQSEGSSPPPPMQTYKIRARFLVASETQDAFSVRLDAVTTVPEYITVTFVVKGKYRAASDGKIYPFTKDVSASLPRDNIQGQRAAGPNDVITELTSMTVSKIVGLENLGKYTVTTEISDWR